MWKEFKAFIMRGNVLDLAVAVIIAGAFGAIVSSFTKDILMPPIGLALGDMDFTQLKYVLKEAVIGADGTVTKPEVAIAYGMFIKYIIDFLIIAFVLFLIVRAYTKAQERNKKEEEAPAPSGPTDNELLTEIRDLLKK
ncbi:MAG TPA: large-conductance mechanosensitive channel protein MscL [Bacteroidetes bacterium]|nr:large-conductance mechanosensitive channel protein MscL [Bacteroidota bacterium]